MYSSFFLNRVNFQYLFFKHQIKLRNSKAKCVCSYETVFNNKFNNKKRNI